jgi:hypothetical protein
MTAPARKAYYDRGNYWKPRNEESVIWVNSWPPPLDEHEFWNSLSKAEADELIKQIEF